MVPEIVLCKKCGKAIPALRRGRPRIYCSPVCKRAGALEIRRIDRRLAIAEARRQMLRYPSAYALDLPDATRREELKAVESEIGEEEIRLRELLGPGGRIEKQKQRK
jgi:hypothetical protein